MEGITERINMPTIKDLQPGDIVFFENHYLLKDPQGNPFGQVYDQEREPYIDHVAIYGGIDARTKEPFLIHCIEGRHTESLPGGLCKTTFRGLGLQSYAHEGIVDYYHVHYKVFRFHDPDFTSRVLKQAEAWSNFNVSYDEAILEKKFVLEDAFGNDYEEFIKNAAESYQAGAKYGILKFAARGNLSPVHSISDGEAAGLTCSMFVMLLYQVTELKALVSRPPLEIIDRLLPISPWPSDKYANNLILSRTCLSYQAYVRSLREREPGAIFDERSCTFTPSIFYWKSDKTRAEAFVSSIMPLDPEVLGAGGLFAYMSKQLALWESLGEVEMPVKTFSVDDKERYKEGVSARFFVTLSNGEKVAAALPDSTDGDRLAADFAMGAAASKAAGF